MNHEFEKGIQGLKRMRLTEHEKATMLAHVLAQRVPSPYARYLRVLVYVKKPVTLALVIFIMIGSTAVFASQQSLPGEKLYSLKTKVFEPVVGAFKTLPEEKAAWEEAKIEKRLLEAKRLAEQHKLDEKKTQELEAKIEQGSRAFVQAAEVSASSTATSTEGHTEKVEKLKKEFREKLELKKEEKADRLKAAANRGLESKSDRDKKNK